MLPLKAIDRLFDRLTLTYGRSFMAQWEGMPASQLVDLKTLWAGELAGFAGRLESLAWALENLPARAPNVIEFKNLCRSAPRPEEPRLPEPKADPERVAAELARLVELRARVKPSAHDFKKWARDLVARDKAGERLNPTAIRMAREALRLNLAPEAV